MIDSNNIDVMRQNIRRLSKAQDPSVIENLITNVEANTNAIGDLNALVGSTPLPAGKTLTSALTDVYHEPTNIHQNITFNGGGYGVVGNIVVCSLRFTVDGSIPSNTTLMDLPKIGGPAGTVIESVLDNNGKRFKMNGTHLQSSDALSSGTSILDLFYLTY